MTPLPVLPMLVANHSICCINFSVVTLTVSGWHGRRWSKRINSDLVVIPFQPSPASRRWPPGGRPLHHREITACVICGLIPSLLGLSFVYIPNFGQAVVQMFNCLSIDKEEIAVLFPRQWITSSQIGQTKYPYVQPYLYSSAVKVSSWSGSGLWSGPRASWRYAGRAPYCLGQGLCHAGNAPATCWAGASGWWKLVGKFCLQ